MEAPGREKPVCPRCGHHLNREKRRVAHRILSIVYPVRYYVCSPACGWTGILPAVSHLKARKRQFLLVSLILFLVLCGIALARHLAPDWYNQHGEDSSEPSGSSE